MKKLSAYILAAILCVFTLSACGQSKNINVSMFDLSRAMLAATEFGDMSYVSSSDNDADDLLANVSDISYDKVDSFFIAYASDGKGNADEIVVIAMKNQKDVTEAAASLKAHLETRRSLYATYDPSQSDKLSEGVVFTRDNLAVLIVSGDNGAVRNSFDTFINNN